MSASSAPTLSVIIPIYNESSARFSEVLRVLDDEIAGSPWNRPEIVIVDDGSTQAIEPPEFEAAEVRVIRQENSGCAEARRTGIEAARGDYLLLLDSRTILDQGALTWVAERVAEGDEAWNGHCVTDNLATPYARFWDIIVAAAWSDYLREPRTTSFGIDDYDRYPTGATQFLAPRRWLLDALAEYDTLFENLFLANDDTLLLRSIARRDRIHISPHFGSRYQSRESLKPFLKHTLRRGTVFVDGHSRRGSRFRPVVLGSLPASLIGTLVAARHPRLGLVGIGGLGLAGTAFALRQGRSAKEAAGFGALVPPFAIVYSAGIWRGAILAAARRF